MLLLFYRILSFFGHVSRRVRKNHRETNEKVWERDSGRYLERLPDRKDYIEHQSRMKELYLGKCFGREFPASYNACEVISVYNALVSEDVKDQTDFSALLSAFEKKGLALGGFFGASPASVEKHLIRAGCQAQRVNGEKKVQEALPQMGKDYRTWVITFQNNLENLREEVHTMCITRHGGDYILHNDYSGGSGYSRYRSLGDVLLSYNEGKAKVISLIGVRS